ncbi:MAG: hypothetical protein DRI37_09270 [Chloroflexi bacterium]|nr:MAG: hypothetical protein DRI37_09270 [Chloroflexota bacterium]
MDFKKDQFIKWTSNDDGGKFNHVGQVVSNDTELVTMMTAVGQMEISVDDGTFTSATKPKNWGERTPAPVVVKVEPVTPQPERNRREAGQPSKKEQAMIIYNDVFGRGHGKKITIQRFMDVLGMSKAGASTYFYNCAKAAVSS